MKCPHCPDVTLVMSDRQGVEIDYCPQCRGVWLDRGELDKLIERSATMQAPAPAQPPAGVPQQQQPYPPRRPDFVDSDYGHQGKGHYKRKSWLSDIFD
ncbi:zf-TFIIB domain-containing protein [Aquincola sp. S2]|uniref:Zf-TFIIB domain-containing protein n=1 Tax=Pseudaquabacterium terrae TaxID=2732868 RepID=A0ABX2EJM7_9BURK|nr:zf-TFIIB domain-containing protein [Aquabacterium terrae]NRF68754.1 zf-TFIIB domain-containing protein [Aquabacterium terrae]